VGYFDGHYRQMHRGISPYLSTQDDTGWPTHYEVRQCIEVWPIPSESTGKLIVKGHFIETPLIADTDKPEMDDQLVYLRAVAMAKAHYSQPDASAYMKDANDYLAKLVAGMHAGRTYNPRRSMFIDYSEPRAETP
jgi:hypothetical protein